MSHSGPRGSQKAKGKPIAEAMARASAKMAHPSPPPAASTQADSAGSSDMDDRDGDDNSSTPRSQADLLNKFENMLQKALQSTSKQITDRLLKEIREIGHRTSVLEDRLDDLSGEVATHDRDIEALRDENQTLTSKLEDLENRSRRLNLRVRGLPEHVTDLQSAVTALFQELSPDIPIERLEIERIHRALTRKRTDGLPRDVIVKLLYFRTKESLLQAARNKSMSAPLSFQGHDYQLFTDLAPTTITKRRAMKPCLEVLTKHHIPYKWGFPFRLLFNHGGKTHSCVTVEEAQSMLSKLGLHDTGHSPSTQRSSSASSSKRSRSDSDPNNSGDAKGPSNKMAPRPSKPG